MLNIYLKSRLYSWRDRQRSGGGSSTRIYKGSWQSAKYLHELPEFRLLLEQIQPLANMLPNAESGNGVAMHRCTEMMASISDRFGYDLPIDCIESGWRGVYCIQAPEKSGGIRFSHPCADMVEQLAKISASHHIYDATEGQLLFFPCWLPYRFEKNESTQKGSDGDRIWVTFSLRAEEQNLPSDY